MLSLNAIWKGILIFILGWLVSFYLFPFNPTHFPALNTKQFVALLGPIILVLNRLRTRDKSIDIGLLRALMIAGLYSVVNLIATDYNGFSDYSYANYITTALVWLFGAYTVVEGIKFVHGEVNFRLITYYFAAVSALQCLIAIGVDKSDSIANIVHNIAYIDVDFFRENGRLYSIGAMLDPAGVRFAVVLMMIATTLTREEKTYNNWWHTTLLLIAFAIILAIGNMISRTTITGAALAVMIMGLAGEGYRFIIRKESFKLYSMLLLVLAIGVPIMVYLYNTDDYFYSQIRYGFEGFFSIVEKGHWQTDSNDVLATMWKWPTTDAGWIIGYGEFGNFRFSTDIGYCRLILYSGVVGFSVFSMLFIHSAWYFYKRYPKYRFFWFLLLCMTFIIWIKVATDLFQFWALFYAFVDYDELAPKYKPQEEQERTKEISPAPALLT